MGLLAEIDALLPQTQCGECGFSGCLPYAKALLEGSAPLDRCPPGGAKTVRALGQLLGISPEPYLVAAEANTRLPAVAKIREEECIGCTKCIQACPVDAIIGSGKLLHSVLASECTGCGLCVEPCPVDCIELLPLAEAVFDKTIAKERFTARNTRLANEELEKEQKYFEKRRLAEKNSDQKAKQDYILQAMARVQEKKNKV